MPEISCQVRYGNLIINPSHGVDAGVGELHAGEWRKALKKTWNKIGWHIHRHFVEKHFTKEGAAEYRAENVAGDGPVYQARSGEGQTGRAFWASYNGRKQKQLGHQLAMVFSKETRDGAKRVSVHDTNHGVRVTLPGCVHLNQYKPPRKTYGPHAGEPPIDLRGDLLAISRREKEEIRALHERLMIQQFGHRLGWYDLQKK